MGKLRCKCGNIIIDQTDNLSYKADILPDTSFDEFLDDLESIIESFLESKEKDKKAEWIDTNFGKDYPRNLSNAQMIGDLITKCYVHLFKYAYQCTECGRVYIQIGNSDKYASFKPEEDNWKGILDKN